MYDGKPGIIKMQLRSLNDCIKVLHSKGRLRDPDRYKRVYIRSSKSHEEKLLEQHTYELLKMQGKADEYTFTGSGKLVRKNCIGPPDKPPNADSNIDPELVNLIQSIIFQHK